MPYSKQGDVLLRDSAFILKYITNIYASQVKVKFHADPSKRGIAAAQKVCEDHLVSGLAWNHWVTDEVGLINMNVHH